MGLLSLLAALAGPRSLGRMARMVQPFLLGVLLLLLFVALAGADTDKLLPLTGADLPGALRGAASAADVLVCPAVGICFLTGHMIKNPPAKPVDFHMRAKPYDTRNSPLCDRLSLYLCVSL